MQSSSSAAVPSIDFPVDVPVPLWPSEIRYRLYALEWDQPMTINGKEYPTLWVWCCRHNIDLWSALLPPSQNESEKLEHEKAVVKKVLDLNWASQHALENQDFLSFIHDLLACWEARSMFEALLRIDPAGVCQKFLGIEDLDLPARIEGETVSLWFLLMQASGQTLVAALLVRASFRDKFLEQILALNWGELKEQGSSSYSFAHALFFFETAQLILAALLDYKKKAVFQKLLCIGNLDFQMRIEGKTVSLWVLLMEASGQALAAALLDDASFRDEFLQQILRLEWEEVKEHGGSSYSFAHVLFCFETAKPILAALLDYDKEAVFQKFLCIRNLDLHARIEGQAVSLWLLFMQLRHRRLIAMLLTHASLRDEFLRKILALNWGEIKEHWSSSSSFAHALLSFEAAQPILAALLKYHPESVCEQFLRIGDLDSQMVTSDMTISLWRMLRDRNKPLVDALLARVSFRDKFLSQILALDWGAVKCQQGRLLCFAEALLSPDCESMLDALLRDKAADTCEKFMSLDSVVIKRVAQDSHAQKVFIKIAKDYYKNFLSNEEKLRKLYLMIAVVGGEKAKALSGEIIEMLRRLKQNPPPEPERLTPDKKEKKKKKKKKKSSASEEVRLPEIAEEPDDFVKSGQALCAELQEQGFTSSTSLEELYLANWSETSSEGQDAGLSIMYIVACSIAGNEFIHQALKKNPGNFKDFLLEKLRAVDLTTAPKEMLCAHRPDGTEINLQNVPLIYFFLRDSVLWDLLLEALEQDQVLHQLVNLDLYEPYIKAYPLMHALRGEETQREMYRTLDSVQNISRELVSKSLVVFSGWSEMTLQQWVLKIYLQAREAKDTDKVSDLLNRWVDKFVSPLITVFAYEGARDKVCEVTWGAIKQRSASEKSLANPMIRAEDLEQSLAGPSTAGVFKSEKPERQRQVKFDFTGLGT